MNAYEDRTLICQDCGAEFVFAAGEQEFFARLGLANEPKRCRSCRQARKAAWRDRPATEVVCANCGAPTIVPFVPRDDAPVYCRECHRALTKGMDRPQER